MSLMEKPEKVHGSINCRRSGCECDLCKDAFMKRQDRKRKETIKGIPWKDLFLCNLCGRGFASKQARSGHEARCEW